MMSTGRPENSVFRHFICFYKDGKQTVRCKYCVKETLRNAPKQCQHLANNCQSVPGYIREEFREQRRLLQR